jgi:type I site-specific restriction endonuclease
MFFGRKDEKEKNRFSPGTFDGVISDEAQWK